MNKKYYFSLLVLLLSIGLISCTASKPISAPNSNVTQSKIDMGNVKNFGAIGNGEHDDTEAFQRAIDAFKNETIDKVYIPSGTYKITKPLKYHTNGYTRGIILEGSGETSKIILDSKQASIALFSIDGSSQRPYQFQRGGSISNLYISSKRRAKYQHALEIVGWWMYEIEHIVIKNMTGHGIYFPLKENIDKNPDAYASVLGEIKQTEISFNDGWGITANCGIGFGGTQINKCRIGENKGGGILMGGHNNIVENSAVFSNGKNGIKNEGGILIKRIQGNGNNCTIRYCELDNNKAYHVKIDGGIGVVVEKNRMNSWETVFNDNELSPSTHVIMKNETNRAKVEEAYFFQNYHRSQNIAKGASKEHELVLYEFSGDVNVSNIEVKEPHISLPDNTSNIKYYNNINQNTKVFTQEKGNISNIKRVSPASSVRIVKKNQEITNKKSKVIFDNIYFEYQKMFDIQKSTFTIPVTGFYLVDFGTTLKSTQKQNNTALTFYLSTSKGTLRTFKKTMNTGTELMSISSMIYLQKGTELYLEANSSSNLTLKPSSTSHWFNVHLIP
jgi:hypothetical protein